MRLTQPMTLAVAMAILEFTGANATVAPLANGHSSTLAKRRHVEERSVAPEERSVALDESHELDERGLVGDILGSIFGHGNSGESSRCPSSFKCNGSGKDGYSYDSNGNGPPSGCSSWKYFGSSVGWAPEYGWTPDVYWSPPSFFYSSCSSAVWWSPPSSWRHPVGFSIPNFWVSKGFHSWEWPSQSWTCSGKGGDGLAWDYQGNTVPSGYPSGWLWFGVSIGWQPPKGWIAPANFSPPSAWISGGCGKAVWWSPSASYQWSIPSGVSIPSWWPSLLPSKSWTCSGSGTDGLTIDWQGNSCPSQYPSEWLWWGVSIGWGPSKGWVPPSSFTPSAAWLGGCGSIKWWSPPASVSWTLPSGFIKPSWWPTLLPSKSWSCSGSGSDGLTIDWQGNSCPSIYPSGWLWFGSSIGWAPPTGWVPGSWTPSASWLGGCGSITWWSPPASWSWTIPSGFTPPAWWPTLLPSPSWTCSGSGKDGLTINHLGQSCPSSLPSGWLWWGVSIGWGPAKGWVPPASFVPSSSFLGACGSITWWSPPSSVSWTLPSGWVQPSWWPTLLPSKSWSCSGSGSDGLTIDWQGNGAPSWVPSGWLWFGTSFGWGPPKGWVIPYASWSPPSAFLGSCGSFAWWTPSASWSWQFGTGFVSPSWWPALLPSPSWKCSGSGKDGMTTNHLGQSCPSQYPSGWLWFGSSIGWAPPHGWEVPSINWTPNSACSGAISGSTWWAPNSGSWLPAPSYTIPDFWWGLGWTSPYPATGWTCNGGGKDGKSYDHNGNTCPYSLPWKWFGPGYGWLPPFGWTPSTPSWTPPSGFTPGSCPWWTAPVVSTSSAAGTSSSAPVPTTTTTTSVAPTTSSSAAAVTTSSSSSLAATSSPCTTSTAAASSSSSSPAATTTPAAPVTVTVTVPGAAPSSSSAASSSGAPPKTITITVGGASSSASPAAPTTVYVTIPGPAPSSSSVKSTSTKAASSSKSTSKAASSTSHAASSTKSSSHAVSSTKSSSKAASSTKSVVKTTTKAAFSTKSSTKAPSSTPKPVTKTITSVFTAPATVATITQVVTIVQTVPGPAPTSSVPAPGWQCNGSGHDGKPTDHNGNSCPYGENGFLWFGTEYGWQPPASFSCSASWSPPIEWGSSCSRSVKWWTPPTHWVAPYWFPVPSEWKVTLLPSVEFTCDGTGLDGWSHDHTGASRPSAYPSGFFYFGISYGWQPSASFQVPSIGWIAPSGWKPQHAKWWAPRYAITLRNKFACPSWWPRTHLSGSWVWIPNY